MSMRTGRVSVPSSSGHRPDASSGTVECVGERSQSLLHQGIGRTDSLGSAARHGERLSPFFIRASAGRCRPTRAASEFESQSLLHQGIGRTRLRWQASSWRSCLSPFFIRASAGPASAACWRQCNGLSPFFIRASAGRLVIGYRRRRVGSQSLLHQGIGRTVRRHRLRLRLRVSVPSSSGHRPDLPCSTHP